MNFKVTKEGRGISVDTLETNKLYLAEFSSDFYLLMTKEDKSVIFIPIEHGGWVESKTKAVSFTKYYEITHMTLNVKEV